MGEVLHLQRQERDLLHAAVRMMPPSDWRGVELPEAATEAGRRVRSLATAGGTVERLVRELGDPDIGFAIVDGNVLADNEEDRRRCLAALGFALGRPFGVFLRHGFWKPVGVNVKVGPNKVEGVGAIPFHIDFVNTTAPPDIVEFHCVRSDPSGGGASLLASFHHALSELSTDDLEVLEHTPLREGRFYDLHGVGNELNPFPVVQFLAGGARRIRFTAKPIDELAPGPLRRALSALDAALTRVATRHLLRRGEFLFINQWLACHAREPLGTPIVAGEAGRLLEQGFVCFEAESAAAVSRLSA